MESVRNWILCFAIVATALPSMGCRICADCEDLAYPAYGGAWQRTRREEGRVGSIFDPAGARISELVNRDLPLTPDEKERALRTKEDDEELGEGDPDKKSDDREKDDPDTDELDKRSKEAEDELRKREKELRDLNLDEIRLNTPEPEDEDAV